MLSTDAERDDRPVTIRLAGIEPDGWKILPVPGICPALWLEVTHRMPLKALPLSTRTPVEQGAGTEREAGLVGREIERSAGYRMDDARGAGSRPGARLPGRSSGRIHESASVARCQAATDPGRGERKSKRVPATAAASPNGISLAFPGEGRLRRLPQAQAEADTHARGASALRRDRTLVHLAA